MVTEGAKQEVIKLAKGRTNVGVIGILVGIPYSKVKYIIYHHRKTHPGDIPHYYPKY